MISQLVVGGAGYLAPTSIPAIDTPNLQAMVNTGYAKLGFGTFVCNNTISVPSNCLIEGEGIGATTVQLAPNSGDIPQFLNADTTDSHITMRKLTVDGNRANQNGDTNKYGIRFNQVSSGVLDSIEVQNVDGDGIRIDGQSNVTRGFELANLYIHNNGAIGLYVTAGMRNILYTNIRSNNNVSIGVEFDHSEGKATNIDCQANGGIGIFIRNVFGCEYNDLHATLNNHDGIFVQGMTSSVGNSWVAACNSQGNSNTFNDVTFSGDNTLSYGITNQCIIDDLIAAPNAQYGTTTEQYCVFIGDPTSGSFGDLKISNAVVGAGVTGNYRLPASIGNVYIEDFPAATQNRRVWVGAGLATPNGYQLGTATSNKLGFYGSAPIVQPSTVGTATGYTAGTTAATFHEDDTYTGNTGTTAYTINGLINNLKTLGLIKA